MQWIKITLISMLLSISLMAGASEATTNKVNINTASAEELTKLDGVGKVKADAIVQHRKQTGGFKNAEELAGVKGIGEATIQKNKDRMAY